METENIDYIVDNLDQVQLLYTDPDKFIDDLYRDLVDCNISQISKNGTSGLAFIRKLQKRIKKELDEKHIHAEEYQKVTAAMIFIFHGVLGLVNSGIDDMEALTMIRSLVKNGIKDPFHTHHLRNISLLHS